MIELFLNNPKPKHNMVAAMSKNYIIGRNGIIPWTIPKDQKRFKKLTTGHTVVMGRKTYESIGHPLPDRRNIVLTKNKNFSAKGIETMSDKKDVDQLEGKIFIIGGEQIYKLFLYNTKYLYLSIIEDNIAGDTRFPFYKDLFDQKEQQHCMDHTYIKYERKKSFGTV